MDPKMDQCSQIDLKKYRKDDVFRLELSESFDERNLARVLQSMVVDLVSFMKSASLMESTHRCILFWQSSWNQLEQTTTHRLAKSVLLISKIFSKCIEYVFNTVLAADIYEGNKRIFFCTF